MSFYFILYFFSFLYTCWCFFTKVSRVLAAACRCLWFPPVLYSLMVVGRKENCAVCGTVVVGVAGRGLHASRRSGSGCSLLVMPQCGPGCSLPSTAW